MTWYWVGVISFSIMVWSITACVGAPTATGPTATWRPLPTVTRSAGAVALPTPAIIASATPLPTPVTHVVQKGETLIGVAVNYGVSVDALQTANPSVQPQFLSIGTVLLIPLSEGTPNPQALSLPTPTPLPVEFSAPTCYPLASGALYCLLEAHNPGPQWMEAVSARVVLADAEGLPLMDQEVYAALDALPPGQSAPLGALFAPIPARPIAAVAAQALGASPLMTPTERYVPLALVAHQGQWQGGAWRVTAQVRNPTDRAALQVHWVLAVYDAQNNLIGFRKGALPDGLASGAQHPFEAAVWPLTGDVDHYFVWVEGRP